MALIVEDGSNVTDADAYISLVDAEAYYLAYNGAAWAGDDEDKEAAIRRATRYLDNLKWKGQRVNGRAQSLDWPRYAVTDCDGSRIPASEIPIEVQRANALLAFYEKDVPNGLNPNVNLMTLAKREKVDVIEIEYRDTAGTVNNAKPVVTSAMDMIGCLTLSGNTRFLERA